MDPSSFIATAIQALVSLLTLPLMLIFAPIDFLLSGVPGISALPASLTQITQFVGTVPTTIVYMIGLNPILWNGFFLIFLLYVVGAPTINMLKKVWAWIRP